MRESRSSGSVEGVMSNRDPYSGCAPQRLRPAFTVTLCRTKNTRITCPKINSSATNATATEKTSPAVTVRNVIAICITPSQIATAVACHIWKGKLEATSAVLNRNALTLYARMKKVF